MTIRLRLTLLYTAILALTVITFSGILYATQSQSIYADIKAYLVRQASLFPPVPRIEPHPLEPRDEPDGLPSPAQQEPSLPSGVLPGRWTQTRDLEGEVTGRTLDLTGVTLPLSDRGLAAAQEGSGWFETVEVQDEPLLIYSQRFVSAEGRGGIVQIAFPVSQPQQSLSTLRFMLLVGSTLAVVVAFGLGWAVAGTGLRPIQRITQTARTIGSKRDFAQRVEHDGPADEVGHLAVTFNEMLAELESGYRQLEETLQSQRRFVADASHELRTPLTTVRGNMELLQRIPTIADAERSDILTDTTEEVDRMIRLVNQLLVLARADAGPALRSEPVSLRSLIQDVCRQAKSLAASRTLRCEAPSDILVGADRDALKQVLLVLVDNAFMHTPPQTMVELTVSADDAQAQIRVADGGPGIAPELLPHIFERFYRGDAARSGRGAGLGLAIAKELVEAQGGSIVVESQPGEGTVFTVTLPLAPQGEPQADHALPAVEDDLGQG